jgi:hypothetical protein
MRDITCAILAILVSQSGFAQDDSDCVTNAIEASVGEFTMRYHVRNVSSGDISIGEAHRSTTRDDENTLIHVQQNNDESYILVDVFDAEGFTRYDVLDDGTRREAFRVNIESCEEKENSVRRELTATQIIEIDGTQTMRRWDVAYDSFGIIANFYTQPADPDGEARWQSFYSLVRNTPIIEDGSYD